MKIPRFVREYAKYRKENPPMMKKDEEWKYFHRIACAVTNLENGFITVNEAMQIITTAHEEY